MADETRHISGGGGIVHGGGQRSVGAEAATDASDVVRAFRRRWASSVAVMTIRDADGYRGITLTGVLPLSIEPPTIAVALTREGGFADRLSEGQRIVLSLLQGEQIFLSERFAGRAPVPDADFSGVPFELDHHGVPMLLESAATVSGTVAARTSQGDHQLVVLAIDAGAIGADQDDPLVTYEASYRRLEVS